MNNNQYSNGNMVISILFILFIIGVIGYMVHNGTIEIPFLKKDDKAERLTCSKTDTSEYDFYEEKHEFNMTFKNNTLSNVEMIVNYKFSDQTSYEISKEIYSDESRNSCEWFGLTGNSEINDSSKTIKLTCSQKSSKLSKETKEYFAHSDLTKDSIKELYLEDGYACK